MITALRQRAHKKSLGGGFANGMGNQAHAQNRHLDSHTRFVKYYARNVALQWGLGARQCVDLQVTGTVAPASYTGNAIFTAKGQGLICLRCSTNQRERQAWVGEVRSSIALNIGALGGASGGLAGADKE
jgi:hypothetical protein